MHDTLRAVQAPLDASPGPGSSPGRRLLVLAFGATFLSRAVAGAEVESLRGQLWLTDQALGTLVSAFAGAYAVALPAGAALGARRRRAALLAGGLALCGMATAASAAAIGFWTLVAARVAAGAGAGLAAGLSVVLLLDGDQRPGGPPRGLLVPAALGLALGYVLGGICGRTPGWRGAFVASGVALLALAPACLRSGEPAWRAAEPWSALSAEGWGRALCRLVGARVRYLPVLAAAVGASAASALAFWLPAFLERTRGVPRLVAGAELGVAVLASGFAGAALGRAGAARGAGRPASGAWTAAAGTAVAAAAMLTALGVASPAVVLPCLMLALLGVFAAARGAVSAYGGGVSDPALAALALLLVHGAGELGGAFGLGAMADRVSFGKALYLLPAALFGSAVLWAAAALAGGRVRRTSDEAGRKVA